MGTAQLSRNRDTDQPLRDDQEITISAGQYSRTCLVQPAKQEGIQLVARPKIFRYDRFFHNRHYGYHKSTRCHSEEGADHCNMGIVQ